MNKIFIPFFILFTFIVSACQFPVTIDSKETVTLVFPQWPSEDDYPELDCWNVTVTGRNRKFSFTKTADTKCVGLELSKDELVSICVKPFVKSAGCKDFFIEAGAVYPIDKTSDNTITALWSNYAVSRSINYLFTEDSYESRTALSFFNWKKLEETLQEKDKESFEKFDSLKTKKCTTVLNVDFETLIERIKNPPSRFTVPYFDTSSVTPDKIKNLNLKNDDIILSPYIPLNRLYKEKGCLTVQTKPKNYKTAFLLNDKLIYVQNKSLYLEQ